VTLTETPVGSAEQEGPMRTPREQVRRALLLAGILPVVLGLAFLAKVMLMGHHDRGGSDAWDARDAATAMEHYSANRDLNFLQPWIAHFDAGNAAFLLGENARAIAYYRDALERVPEEHECTVRINMSLTQEAIGDRARDTGDQPGAKAAYEAALITLREGDCPTDAGQGPEQSQQGESVEERLKEKLVPKIPIRPDEQDEQPEQQQKQDEKEDKLDQRNGAGEEYRRDDEDLDDYGGFSDEPQW
jgi:tetratricopeptide (TPR) repeat protein